MSESYFIGIDVGSAEVRCGLVTSNGEVVRVETQTIVVFNPGPGYFQQSSKEIWANIILLVKKLTDNIDENLVKGIGCDATCSLVVVGEKGRTVSVSPQGEKDQDVIMWMDHRASTQADIINKSGHPLLEYLGGKVSLEMQMPKLMWLKKNLPETFKNAQYFFDLPDFLTWKLTGSDTRSQCSLVCKWMYEGSPNASTPGWNQSFLKSIDLEELCNTGFSKIGGNVCMPGQRVGYLSKSTANELGLREGTPVGASLIDAHAGTIGLIGTRVPLNKSISLSNKIGMICGTSSCFMLLSEKGVKVDGVWGPYYGAALENLWLSEGGQSAAGQLLDRLVASHPSRPNTSDPALLCSSISQTLTYMALINSCHLQSLTRDFHVYPDFRGNRSPLADPSFRGMISGLDLTFDEQHLALVYLSAIQALSYSARQTVEKLESKGLGPVKCLVLCGGLSKNKLFVETLAGVLARPIVIPRTSEAVLLGSAMLGAAAANFYSSLSQCALSMASEGKIVEETDESVLRYHDMKYQVYMKMQSDQLEYKRIMRMMSVK